jgi:hypothetical protein
MATTTSYRSCSSISNEACIRVTSRFPCKFLYLTIYKKRTVPTSHLAPTTMLDTPVPSQDVSLELSCLIEGESIVFEVTVGRNWGVSALKKAIKSERALGTLKDVGPHTLELWKVSAIDESRCEVTLAYSRTLTGQH